MSIVLRSEVGVMGQGLSLSGQPAVMDLHDNDRFVLIKFNPRTGEFGERVFDTPVSSLRVSGTSTYLTISEGRVKRRVDFAGNSPVGVAGFGLLGYAIQASYASQSGIKSWVEVFRERGVMRRQLSTARRLLIFVGILVGIIVVLFVATSIATIISH